MSIPALSNSARSCSASPPSAGIGSPTLAVVGEGEQGRLRHRVDREGRGEALDVEGVGGVRVLGPGARPEQPLRAGALVHQPLPAVGVEQLAVGAVGAAADRDAEPVVQLLRRLVLDGDVPAAHEDRGDRGDVGIEPGLDPPLDPLHVGIGRGQVLLGREEQRDVDRDPGEDRLLDRRQAGLGAGDLDEEVVALGLGVERGRPARSSPRCRRRAAARPPASRSRRRRRCARGRRRRGRRRRAGRRSPARRRAPRSSPPTGRPRRSARRRRRRRRSPCRRSSGSRSAR